ncbi:MAG: protein phosphatase 2C domain-containing protein [Methylomonas sp.]|nr:protein phosphatase 2C domain-containing protein [Methylomonas sp.]
MAIERVFNRYSVCGLSDCGLCREINEDSILLNTQSGVFLLADGMGGHRSGDKASNQAVTLIDTLMAKHLPVATVPLDDANLWQKICRLFKKPDRISCGPNLESQSRLIADILIEANRVIYRDNQQAGLDDGSGMGTTLVGCRIVPALDKLQVFHVGDSRLYRMRRGELLQISKDHSLYQLWLDGGQIGESPATNRIYQGIGPAPSIKPDVQMIDIEADDAFLLCSDGLTDCVSDLGIADILQDLGSDNIEIKARTLIDQANRNGGTDNISVILICQ